MTTKLTLRIDEELIKAAKKYSAQKGKSVSKLVTEYFQLITNEKLKEEKSLTPTVRSLKGILKGKELTEQDYKKHLEEKYL
jgi:hypothetical protein